jgi:peptidoglycan/xylan/chitin deacetylase (PgdA/CDA1 family)
LKTLAERLKLAPLVHFGLARSGAIRHYVRVPALRAAAERVLGFPLSRYVVQRTVLSRAGVLDDIWRKLSPGVYIFNYHRIGDPKKTDFDPNVFSCDEEHFAKQVGFLKQRFRIIGIRELVDDVLTNQRVTEPLALITFDDGYRDNFTGAFPILREANVPAVFFIPTSFVGTGQVPWWDEIAWMVRHTKLTSVALPFADARVELRERPVQFAIRDVLTAFKRSPGDAADKVEALRKALDCRLPDSEVAELFVSWEDLRAMRAGGMDIGSHTHTHRILSHLSGAEQLQELETSKQSLEANLGEHIDSIAYPVGAVDSFTDETMALTERCGYQVGFSFIDGVNVGGELSRFAMLRMAVEDNATPTDLQYSVAFAGESSIRKRLQRHWLQR